MEIDGEILGFLIEGRFGLTRDYFEDFKFFNDLQTKNREQNPTKRPTTSTPTFTIFLCAILTSVVYGN
jgi:hypothetical protein